MSNSVFPNLPGLKWDVGKSPVWATAVKEVRSGKEYRAAYWSYPRWKFSLAYELLRDDATDELKTLLGFFLQRQGKFDTFLFSDPDDNTVTGQIIGTGNGTLKTFQLCRTLGGFIEPMKAINGMPVIKLNGVTQSSGWSMSSTGLITFTTAPANGSTVTADFSYYFRCRFNLDEAEFSKFAQQLWEMKKCEFISVK